MYTLSICCHSVAKNPTHRRGLHSTTRVLLPRFAYKSEALLQIFPPHRNFPPQKSRRNQLHTSEIRKKCIFLQLENIIFMHFFLVKKSVKPSPLSPHSWVDHVPPRGEFVDPWKSVCESNGCWWTLGRKEKEWRLTDVSCLPVTSRVITSLIRVTCYPFIRSFVRGITHNSIYN